MDDLTNSCSKKNQIPSRSEEAGLAYLRPEDKMIYSVGISTAGRAEARMAQEGRTVIASTIDEEGANYTRELYGDLFKVVVEDVSEALPYPAAHFDFIYTRLCLHYLPFDKLDTALSSLYRILKPKGHLFVVVRSTKCPHAKRNPGYRTFHTPETITDHLEEAHFALESLQTYSEKLCWDYARKIPSTEEDHLIQVHCTKKM